MGKRKILTFLLFCNIVFMFSMHHGRCSQHIYLVYYATVNGETGHSGIAVDKYKIVVIEHTINGATICKYDTVRTGSLTYYDLWPKEDYFERKQITSDKESRYYKLPQASWEPEISVQSLIMSGVPHKEGYPVDGLLQIATTPSQDKCLGAFLDSLIYINRPFNAITYNCADFAEQAIEFIIKKDIRAKEFIWIGCSTTPNKLFRKAARLENTKIIKDPEKLVHGIFLIERVLKREILKTVPKYN